ncbi:MAG: glycerate kinase [Halanaerobiales bacterium]|nr:glycerate kinase [Halanaerobiales bacterium]
MLQWKASGSFVEVGKEDDFTERDHGIDAIFSIINEPMDLSEAMEKSASLVSDTIFHIMRLIHAVNGVSK